MQKPTNKKRSTIGVLPKQKNTYKKTKKQNSTTLNFSQEKLSKSFLSSDTTIKKLVKQIPVIKETKDNSCEFVPHRLPDGIKYGQPTYKNKGFKTINNQNREELEKALANISAILPIGVQNNKQKIINKKPKNTCELEGIVKTGKSGCPCCPF